MGPLPSGFIAEVIPSACLWLAVVVEEEPRLLSLVLRPPTVVASLPCLMCPPMCAAIVDLHQVRLPILGAAVDVIEPWRPMMWKTTSPSTSRIKQKMARSFRMLKSLYIFRPSFIDYVFPFS